MSDPLLPPTDWRSRLVEIGNYRLPLPQGWHWPASWQKLASASEQRSLLRLILAATEQHVSLTSLIEAWAKAERPTQRFRLRKLADQLRSDLALADAIESVPGILSQESLLAIRCAVQTAACHKHFASCSPNEMICSLITRKNTGSHDFGTTQQRKPWLSQA